MKNYQPLYTDFFKILILYFLEWLIDHGITRTTSDYELGDITVTRSYAIDDINDAIDFLRKQYNQYLTYQANKVSKN